MRVALKPVGVMRVGAGIERADEWLVVEEPLEIRVAGEAVASTMRTPGEDSYLALGYLFAEGVIGGAADVANVVACAHAEVTGYPRAVDVIPHGRARIDPERLAGSRRLGAPSSACGVCGRDGIDDLLRRVPPRGVVPGALQRALVARVPELLAAHQPAFARTGGLHAVCAVDAAGVVRAHAEDVGRHNAADKVLGRLLCAESLPPPGEAWLLAVSGRASFELVQKAAAAGFAGLASISAPSSLAVDTADALGLTLAAFVRAGRFTLYTHAAQVLGEEATAALEPLRGQSPASGSPPRPRT